MASSDEVNSLVAAIQKLKNRDLMSICTQQGAIKSGNKADLLKRIVNMIDSSVHDPNPSKYQSLKNYIQQVVAGVPIGRRTGDVHGAGVLSTPATRGEMTLEELSSPYNNKRAIGLGGPPSPAYGSKLGLPPGSQTALTNTNNNGYSSAGAGDAMRRQLLHQGLQFKASPFYDVLYPVGDVQPCEAMVQHRNSISISMRASAYPELQRLASEPSHRVMVFCAASNQGPQDIAFPYQCEIKMNTGEVKANLRGLKNKPGSTRPADITDYLRLKPSTYANNLEFTYALTTKRFYLGVYICRVYSATVLAGRIEQRSRITRASVVREIAKQAQDPDIVATSYVLSLKCPLTYMRLAVPVRATTCKHIQCFDATSYLQLQEQGPQWLCPVCSNPAPYDALAVDEYNKDILENTPSDLEQVTIDPDGTWHMGGRDTDSGSKNSNNNRRRTGTPPHRDTLTLDDELEILTMTTPGPSGSSAADTSSTTTTTTTTTTTDPSTAVPYDMMSRDTTAAASSASVPPPPGSAATTTTTNGNGKRTREVVDLTLSSDDEDDEPPRPFKRQNMGYSTSSLYNNPSV